MAGNTFRVESSSLRRIIRNTQCRTDIEIRLLNPYRYSSQGLWPIPIPISVHRRRITPILYTHITIFFKVFICLILDKIKLFEVRITLLHRSKPHRASICIDWARGTRTHTHTHIAHTHTHTHTHYTHTHTNTHTHMHTHTRHTHRHTQGTLQPPEEVVPADCEALGPLSFNIGVNNGLEIK